MSNPVKINIDSEKKKLINTLQNYYLYNIDETCDENDSNEKQIIIQRIKESNLVIIDQFIYKDKSDKYLVIGFHKTIIIIKDSSIKLLQPLFTNNTQLKFYFLHNFKNIFDTNYDIGNDRLFQYSDNFDEEVYNFNQIIKINHPHENKIYQMQNSIKSCISGYLIGESYFKLIEEQKTDFSTAFNKESNQKEGEKSNIKEWTEDEYIELRNLGSGSLFIVSLIYQIEKGHLFSMKKPYYFNEEIPKLYTREKENYSAINYPFIPKIYGKQEKDNRLIIQFILGQTLDTIDITKLTLEDKITIMIELILIIQYLHDNKFVYRDLKPNNVIIDENKTIFLIDFDRMITINSSSENENFTKDFQSAFIAPEVNSGEISYKNDIYSIGKMIEYLELAKENNEINSLYHNCINLTANQRPFIFELIIQFYSIFIQRFNKTSIVNFPEIQYLQGLIYYEGKYIERDINKSIHYFLLAANQNHPYAQSMLGFIYDEGKYIERDINKSIHYYSLAVNQNDLDAQFNLGFIYYEGKYISRDINKSIHYYSLAANQNYPDAQFNLGNIYYEGKYIERDINKSIHYFSLAANQNYPDAQFNLGNIYYEGKYISRDINKSIHYYSLAANQNYPIAQNSLGLIYLEGKYIERDINKSIHYFLLAANQNDSIAQYGLGFIYYEGKYISRDINKSIHYYSLAANQNDPAAQFMLGVIYYEGKYISQDINKSIHYFSLAANQNYPDAQFMLGVIYYEGKYISQDINKSIHYFSLAADQNHPIAQFSLSLIYYEGKYIERDINKSIHYLSLAANQNHPGAQFILGIYYSHGIYYNGNMVKAIDYFIQSASNGNIESHFIVGYFYHEGKHVERDIKKSIHHYKEASSFDNQYAKNNLGIIYRFGCGDEFQPNCGISMSYFEEAIRRFQDKVSMYNLAHIYIYKDNNKDRLKKSIELLIESIKLDFSPSTELLCIALIKLFGLNIEIIHEELNKLTENSSKLSKSIYGMIIDLKLLYEPNYEHHYKLLSTINYLYDFDKKIISTKTFNKPKPESTIVITGENITQEFYEGFGIDLQQIQSQ